MHALYAAPAHPEATTLSVFPLQNGQLKAKIEGVNTPTLSAQIMSLTPANADMDDLEVSEGQWAGWSARAQPPCVNACLCVCVCAVCVCVCARARMLGGVASWQ